MTVSAARSRFLPVAPGSARPCSHSAPTPLLPCPLADAPRRGCARFVRRNGLNALRPRFVSWVGSQVGIDLAAPGRMARGWEGSQIATAPTAAYAGDLTRAYPVLYRDK